MKSNKVGFVINNISEKQPPAIKLITPAIGTEDHYETDKEEFDLIGEVKAESAIKFVSVNSEMREINEYGLFSWRFELDPGENRVKIVAMDVNDNIREHNLTIDYIPTDVTLAEKITRDAKYYAVLIGIDEYGIVFCIPCDLFC